MFARLVLLVVSYEVSVVTDRQGAGTDANDFVQIFRDKGLSDKCKLKNGDNNF